MNELGGVGRELGAAINHMQFLVLYKVVPSVRVYENEFRNWKPITLCTTFMHQHMNRPILWINGLGIAGCQKKSRGGDGTREKGCEIHES